MRKNKTAEELYLLQNFPEIEKRFNLKFEDRELLIRAFTHGSYNNEIIGNYQRLEFLGDAILQIIVSDYIYRIYNNQNEGEMSKERGALVSEFALAYVMKKEHINDYVLFGKSLKTEEVKNSNSYISDVYEAFIAAIYLDQGYAKADAFVKETLLSRKEEILSQDFLQDYKTILQEKLQVNGNIDIKYISEPSEKGFLSSIVLEGQVIGKGEGKTKKQAEQQAAKDALKNRRE